MAILTVQHLEKHFGKTKVLNDISFSLEQGQALSIIGSSGSGKTTLLRCLNFLETPDAGPSPYRTRCCLTLRSARPSLSGNSEEASPLRHGVPVLQSLSPIHGAGKRDAGTRADGQGHRRKQGSHPYRRYGSSGADGLADRADHYPHQLSGGQQQRVAIARALALHPDILCFDEPTSALDPELTGEVLKVIRGLAEQKTTMIIVTHEMAFARDVADQVIFMDGGFIVEQGDPKQVIDHPQEERTRQFLSRFAENN